MKHKNDEDEVDLFDEFKIRPMTKGLGFHQKNSHKENQKISSTKSDSAFSLPSSENTPRLSSKTSEKKSENPENPSNNKRAFTTSYKNSHSPKKLNAPGFSSLDKQLMEMNTLMEELNHSFKAKNSVTKTKTKEEPEFLDLEWENSKKRWEPKKAKTENISPLPSTHSSPPKVNFLKEKKSQAQKVSLKRKTPVPISTPNPTLSSIPTSSPPSSSVFNFKTQKKITQKKTKNEPFAYEWISASSPHIGVLILDALMSLSFCLLFFFTLIKILKLDFMSLVLKINQGERLLILCFLLLYLSHLFVYLIVSRGFFGQSLGEWMFGYRIGSSSQRKNPFYPFLVLWRLSVIFMTGILTFPFFSFLFKKDLAFYFTGLPLQKRKNWH